MIKNERQQRITKTQADKFRAAIAAAQAAPQPKTANERTLARAAVKAMQGQLETLEDELRAYAELQMSAGRRALLVPLTEIGAMLIQARAARGWSQRELGERVGVKMQMIQRYEATEYAHASLTTIGEICQALGLTGTISADLVTLPELSVPALAAARKAAAGRK